MLVDQREVFCPYKPGVACQFGLTRSGIAAASSSMHAHRRA
jgi:hypothetical protein